MIYRIGTVEMDCARQELKNHGELVAVQKKVFELMVFLIENRGRALTKDEIQAVIVA